MHKVEFINLLENIIRHPCCLIARLRVEKLSVIAVNDILSKHNPQQMVRPLTARSDQYVTSPNNIHSLSRKQVMRILKVVG